MFLYTRTPQSHITALPNGASMHCASPRELQFLYDEIYGDSIYLKNGITVKEGDCVLDVGAHVGMFSLFLSERYADLDLYAIEPVPANHAALLDNAERHFPLARCIPLALAERERRLLLTWYPQLSGWSTRYPELSDLRQTLRTHCALANYPLLGPLARRAPRAFNLWASPLLDHMQIEVEAVTLSTLMANERISAIDLLKIDVEGSELQILLGIAEPDWSRIRQMVIKTTHADLDAVARLLRLHGFHACTDVSLGLRGTSYIFVYARHPERCG